FLVSTVEVDHSSNIVLSREHVLPGIGFGVFITDESQIIEWGSPLAVGLATSEEAGCGVKVISIIRGAVVEKISIGKVAKFLGHRSDAPVVDRIFDRFRRSLFAALRRAKASVLERF